METMSAVQLVKWGAPPELREIPVPEVTAGTVLLKVDAVGLCHSDLHLMEWPEGMMPYELPFTLGHEVAGTVAAAGEGVDNVSEGEAVLVYGPWGCERCYSCATGSVNVCEHAWERGGHGCGLGFDGGLAEYMLIPTPRYLVPIGEMDPVTAAPVADAILSPYHSIKPMLGRLRAGAGVVVIGVGGLGHCGLQLVKALSATKVVALDVREDALNFAKELGADQTFDVTSAAAEEIKAALPGNGAQLVLDFVGSEASVELGRQLLGTSGHYAVIGVGGGALPMGLATVPLETSSTVPNWGTLPELFESVELARDGRVHLETTTFALEDTLAAYDKLRNGEVRGRAVVVP